MLVSGVKGRAKEARSARADAAVEGEASGIQGTRSRAATEAPRGEQGRDSGSRQRKGTSPVRGRSGADQSEESSLVSEKQGAAACLLPKTEGRHPGR